MHAHSPSTKAPCDDSFPRLPLHHRHLKICHVNEIISRWIKTEVPMQTANECLKLLSCLFSGWITCNRWCPCERYPEDRVVQLQPSHSSWSYWILACSPWECLGVAIKDKYIMLLGLGSCQGIWLYLNTSIGANRKYRDWHFLVYLIWRLSWSKFE